MDIASISWALTQHQPLDMSHFIDEARRRGYDLSLSTLRELYQHWVIVPFVYVNSRQVGPMPDPIGHEPSSGGALLTELRYARDRGLSRFSHRQNRSHHHWPRCCRSADLCVIPGIRQSPRSMDHDRAELQAARADAAERKRQEQLAHEAGASAAKAMKAQLDAWLAELRTLLTSVLVTPPQLSFAMLSQSAAVPPFEPGDLGKPLPVPVWEDFAPPPPGVLSGLVGGKARHARAQEAARDAFEHARADHALAEDARAGQLQEASSWSGCSGAASPPRCRWPSVPLATASA